MACCDPPSLGESGGGMAGPVLSVGDLGPGSLHPSGQRCLLWAGLKLVALEVVGRAQAAGC